MVYHLQPWISLPLYARETLISHSVGLSASYGSFEKLEMQSEKADQAQLWETALLQCLVKLPGRGTSGYAVGCWAGSALLCCVGKFDTEAKMWHGGSLDHSKWIRIKDLAKLFSHSILRFDSVPISHIKDFDIRELWPLICLIVFFFEGVGDAFIAGVVNSLDCELCSGFIRFRSSNLVSTVCWGSLASILGCPYIVFSKNRPCSKRTGLSVFLFQL